MVFPRNTENDDHWESDDDLDLTSPLRLRSGPDGSARGPCLVDHVEDACADENSILQNGGRNTHHWVISGDFSRILSQREEVPSASQVPLYEELGILGLWC